MTSEEKFFIKETNPKLSKSMINIKGGVLTVQITGSATSFECEILGCADIESGEFVVLNGVDVSSYSMHNQITKTGIYEYDISGIRNIQAKIISVSGGDLTIVGIGKEG